MPSDNLVNHGGHIIAASVDGHIRMIESLTAWLSMKLRTHQQGQHKNLGWSLLQMLNNRIILWLHLSLEFFYFAFAYRPFNLIFLLSSKGQLFGSVTSPRSIYTMSGSSFNHKFWLDNSFWWNQGNSLRRCQDHVLLFLLTLNEAMNFSNLLCVTWVITLVTH